MILYATQQGNSGVLSAVSADGAGVKQVLRFQKGDVREPAWSPYNRKPLGDNNSCVIKLLSF